MIGQLRESYSRQQFGTPIIVVSGLPRSGTSMMMKMLEAGGVEILTDNVRAADGDNTDGYYEYERVKTLDKDGDRLWLGEAKGKAIKIISALLKHLPQDHFYKVIFMNRNLDEVMLSQAKMLAHRNVPSNAEEDDKIKIHFHNHLEKTKDWLNAQLNFNVLELSYKDVLDDPAESARKLAEFLEKDLCVEKMAAAVNRELYRNRR